MAAQLLFRPKGGHVTFKVRAAESSGMISVAEYRVPPEAGPRLHVHEVAEECIYVLCGQVQVQLGEETHDATSGSCVFIPRGLLHCFVNTSEHPASLSAVYTPGGIEAYFEDLASAENQPR